MAFFRQHYLDVTGQVVVDLPEPSLSPAYLLVEAVCRFVAYATNFDCEGDEIPICFVSIGQRVCNGKVLALVSIEDDDIRWHCEACGGHGIISGWKNTFWDLSEASNCAESKH